MNALVPLGQGGKIASIFKSGYKSSLTAAGQANVQAGFAVVGFKGKTWSVRHRGETKFFTKPDGSPEPFLDVVVVGVAAGLSKKFYMKKYTDGDMGAPDCFSVDGVAPDPSAAHKQATVCQLCPKAAWGSRKTDAGKDAKACQDSRRLAVVIFGTGDTEPMMLSLPPMSLSGFADYCKKLDRLGACLEGVATRLKFDYSLAYQKIDFECLGGLDDETANKVVNDIMQNPVIGRMMNESVVADANEGAVDEQAEKAEAAVAQATAIQQAPPATQPPKHEPPAAAEENVVSIKRGPTPFAAAQTEDKPKPRTKAAATQTLQPAPADLGDMIDNLLGSA